MSDSAAGGRTDRCAGIILRKAHAFRRQVVHVRRFDFPLAVAAEIGISQIVRHDKNDVGLLRRRGFDGWTGGEQQRSAEYWQADVSESIHIELRMFESYYVRT